MKRSNSKFFIAFSPLCMVIASVLLMSNDANAARASISRGTPVAAARKTVTSSIPTVSETATSTSEINTTSTTSSAPSTTYEEPEIADKSDKFGSMLSSSSDSSFDGGFDNLADQIRQQNAALQAKENTSAYQARQNVAAATGKNPCDTGLRKCMQAECGKDFTKCALDGDTIMGDKFNKCRRDLECTGEEFKLFTNEIKADRDLNVKLSSYSNVIDCGNAYNKCIVSECGTTFNKCLGKQNADRAIQNCASVAKECVEQDSGLASRFGTVIGKLREVAEIEVKKDEEHMYELRDLMRKQCEHLGASFDERSFDCVYNVQFFAGDEQIVPMASRNMYAGDTFVCMQEFFGINATTYKENAYRETRAQTAASSAMLGSGLGTAAGLVTSGAIGRALDTQKAKKALKKECLKDGGIVVDGECESVGKAVRQGKEDLKQAQKEAHEQIQAAGKNLKEDLHTGNEILKEGNETLKQGRQAIQTTEGMVTDATGTVFEVVDQAGNTVGNLGENVGKVGKGAQEVVHVATDVVDSAGGLVDSAGNLLDGAGNLIKNGVDGVAAIETGGASAVVSSVTN
ncbi:MAG: hypothetical protein IKN73_01550 [Alphaproteobacteria bacterium]|nr:hypothetical protein [Alphaproteobacteria bacterium]